MSDQNTTINTDMSDQNTTINAVARAIAASQGWVVGEDVDLVQEAASPGLRSGRACDFVTAARAAIGAMPTSRVGGDRIETICGRLAAAWRRRPEMTMARLVLEVVGSSPMPDDEELVSAIESNCDAKAGAAIPVSTRGPDHVQRICDRLRKDWERFPDQSLGEILYEVEATSGYALTEITDQALVDALLIPRTRSEPTELQRNHINATCLLLANAWARRPDLTLGQVVGGAEVLVDEMAHYLDDGALIAAIESLLGQQSEDRRGVGR